MRRREWTRKRIEERAGEIVDRGLGVGLEKYRE